MTMSRVAMALIEAAALTRLPARKNSHFGKLNRGTCYMLTRETCYMLTVN